jgi:hypothetical protein
MERNSESKVEAMSINGVSHDCTFTPGVRAATTAYSKAISSVQHNLSTGALQVE